MLEKKPLFRLAHISDLHFGREIPEVAQALLDRLQQLDATVIVLSGDLTQRARHSEFRRAQAFLEQLTESMVLIPGNHDLAAFNLLERFFNPWGKWRRYMQKDLEPQWQGSGLFIKGINTARKLGDRMDWSRGGINERQLEDIQEAMSSAPPASLKLLVAHHPFWLPPAYERRHLVDGRDQAIPLLRESGVDMILSGHIHLAFSHLLQGIMVSHAGTGISDRLLPAYPNSFNVLEGDSNQVALQVMEWSGSDFAVSRTEQFQRTGQGWMSLEHCSPESNQK